MACIGNIAASLEIGCGAHSPGFGRIQGAKLLNAADIASFTVGSGSVAIITRVATKVGYGITTINDALTLSVGVKSQDIIPGAYDVTITFKHFGTGHSSGVASDSSPLGSINLLARAELVFAVDHGNGVYRVYGLGAPLVCLEYNLDSTADGYSTFTYGVEDWQVGTTIHALTKADYDALSTPAE
jgi:hypothetical protein|nr:MAG TPA: hypothetical protein [Caudoviricetes sp.]